MKGERDVREGCLETASSKISQSLKKASRADGESWKQGERHQLGALLLSLWTQMDI